MKQWIDESGQEYGFDTHDMHLFKDEEMTMEISMNSITKEQLAKIIGGEPIIRCKECKYYRWEIDMCNEPYSTAHNIVHEDDYCSRAERKEE